MFEEEFEPPPSLADVRDDPAGVAVWAAAARPGPDVMALVSMLDPRDIPADERVDLLVALERQAAWIAALQQRTLAALRAEPLRIGPGADPDQDWTREQVGAALRLSPLTADRRLTVARQLIGRLPEAARMLARGEICYLHAARLADAVEPFDDNTAAQIEQLALRRADEQTVGQFTSTLRRAVIVADPRAAEQRHEDAVTTRRVRVIPATDGMSILWALLPADGASLIASVLDSLATVRGSGSGDKLSGGQDERSSDQRRADGLVDVFARIATDPRLPEQRGRRPSVQVTVSLSTLLGADERPGDLAGYGPITAAAARRIAADATGTWRRLVTDPVTGGLLDYGRRTYRPPTDLADFVIARDQTCVFPGCRRTARRCDLDHALAWESGGTTDAQNLAPLCRRHHRAKHDAGWRRRREPDGSYAWTAPTGHSCTVTPPPYLPDG